MSIWQLMIIAWYCDCSPAIIHLVLWIATSPEKEVHNFFYSDSCYCNCRTLFCHRQLQSAPHDLPAWVLSIHHLHTYPICTSRRLTISNSGLLIWSLLFFWQPWGGGQQLQSDCSGIPWVHSSHSSFPAALNWYQPCTWHGSWQLQGDCSGLLPWMQSSHHLAPELRRRSTTSEWLFWLATMSAVHAALLFFCCSGLAPALKRRLTTSQRQFWLANKSSDGY